MFSVIKTKADNLFSSLTDIGASQHTNTLNKRLLY